TEDAPSTDLAVDRDRTTEAGHDPVANREAEPRPLFCLLRGEEWLENSGKVLARNAATRIVDFHHGAPPIVREGDDADLLLARVPFADGVVRVDEEIREHLNELPFAGLDERGRPVHEPKQSVVTNRVGRHPGGGIEDVGK